LRSRACSTAAATAASCTTLNDRDLGDFLEPLGVGAGHSAAAQTIDTRIAGLIDSKAGLAACALDGSDEEA
jgi:hypothetical protein